MRRVSNDVPVPAPPPRPPKQEGMPQSVKGMRDIIADRFALHAYIEEVAKNAMRAYQFTEIDVPVVEATRLYQRGSGETTDIVTKELYAFETRGGDKVSLRPEFTPGIARAYVERGMSRMGLPQRVFTAGPLFRHDKPQAGRYRQFTQVDAEIIGGTSDPVYDAQTVAAFYRVFATLKVPVTLEINSIGDRVCRPGYRKLLVAYYEEHRKQLCEDCTRRLETNPLRLLDCKEPGCKKLRENAPKMLDKLCSPCSAHFTEVMEYLEELGIPCSLNPYLVRGLDYYNRTVFEFVHEIGSLAGGGRYDYLLETLGSRPTPAVGAALGVDRIADALGDRYQIPGKKPKAVFVAHAGEKAKKCALALSETLISAGIPVRDALAKDSLKAQLKTADKDGLPLALIVGQKEAFDKSAIIREVRTGLQESFPISRIVEEVKRRLKDSRE